MITYDEANFLNGYHNVVGELIEGDDVLAQMESASCRASGKVHGHWAVSAVGQCSN